MTAWTLLPGGREPLAWNVTGVSPGTEFDVTVDGVTWLPLVEESEGVYSVLVAHPDAVDNPAGTLVLSIGWHTFMVRQVAEPSILIRDVGNVRAV